eukprot:2897278-Heterocapsa_arctica.AAC.1
MWGDALTDHMFWNIILHNKESKSGHFSYMVKYWPFVGMAFIKTAGMMYGDAPKRKCPELGTECPPWKGGGRG